MDTLVDDNLIWPSDNDLAQKMSMAFMIKVLDAYDFNFENYLDFKKKHDPLTLSKKYLEGKVTDIEIHEAYQYWTDNMSEDEWRSPFINKISLAKRLAICPLFCESNKGVSMTHLLHFFAEVLDTLGYDIDTHLTSISDELLESQGKLSLVKLVSV